MIYLFLFYIFVEFVQFCSLTCLGNPDINIHQISDTTPFCFSGICPVNQNSIDYLLSSNGTGNAVVIVIGGAAESLDCAPGMNSVTLKKRKGFVKLALKQG